MKLQRQPTNKTCGQTCVAMILGKPVQKIIDLMGSRKMNGRELRDAINAAGEVTGSQIRWPKAGLITCKLAVVMKTCKRDGETFKHWVVLSREPSGCPDETPLQAYKVYDPALNGVHSLAEYQKKGYMQDSAFTSYFQVLKMIRIL